MGDISATEKLKLIVSSNEYSLYKMIAKTYLANLRIKNWLKKYNAEQIALPHKVICTPIMILCIL